MHIRHLAYACALGAACSLTGCLDEHPKGQLNEEQAYATARSLYVNTVATLYNYIGGNADSQGLQGTYRGVYDYNTFTTDEAILPTRGGDWYDGEFWQNLYRHEWTPSDEALNDTWNYLYKVVALCNRSLELLDGHADLLTEGQLQSYTAEVRGIRALFYYYLMDMFGRVPLLVKSNTAIADVQQADRATLYLWIVGELEGILPLLPNERSNYEGQYYGRVTRPVATFLLAKLMLAQGVYTGTPGTTPTTDAAHLQACIGYCDELEAEGYALAENYEDNFAVHNENSVENIFTIPMDKTLYGNIFKNIFRSIHYNHGGALGMACENGTSATLHALSVYGYGTDDLDARFAKNCYYGTITVDDAPVMLDNGQQLCYVPEAVGIDITGSPYEKTAGARMRKYEPDRTAYNDGQLQANDIVLFRFADVLLMRAEAKVRLGGDGSDDLDAVRARAGMPQRKATLANILDERLMELHWEGWRRQDLIRFDCFHKADDLRGQQADEGDRHTTLFPIPSSVLRKNGNLTQNPGYSQ